MRTTLIVSPEHVQDGLLPVSHLSYSAIRAYQQSENLFYKRYVRREFDDQEKPSMLIGKAAHETIEKFWQDITENDARREDEQTFYPQFADAVFSRMLRDARKKAAEKLDFRLVATEVPLDGQWVDKNGVILVEEEAQKAIEEKAIKWSKTVTEESAREALAIAVRNYITNADDSETISTETSETVIFSDLEGNIMPVPLKGIIDRIERHKVHGKGLRDYKIVAKFSDDTKRNAAYDQQAAAFYFVYQGIKGEAPEYALFEEVLKKEPGYILPEDPNRRLLQADLKALCDDHGIEYGKYSKNSELQASLVEHGVLVKEPSVKHRVYRYDEHPEILEAFLEIYKRIVNRLGLVALYSVEYGELSNPFDQMNGEEAWEDFLG